MNRPRMRLYLVLFGVIAVAIGAVILIGWTSGRVTEDLLGTVAVLGGLAMIIVGLWGLKGLDL